VHRRDEAEASRAAEAHVRVRVRRDVLAERDPGRRVQQQIEILEALGAEREHADASRSIDRERGRLAPALAQEDDDGLADRPRPAALELVDGRGCTVVERALRVGRAPSGARDAERDAHGNAAPDHGAPSRRTTSTSAAPR
jgi:hypothetical protein